MAFDLNKNDGSVKDSSDKVSKASSKFDLSKGELEEAVVPENSRKSKTWIIGLIGVLIIGGGIWYYSAGKKTTDSAGGALTEVAASDSIISDSSAVVGAKTAKQSDMVLTEKPVIPSSDVSTSSASAVVVPAETASGNENTLALNNKIPATFAQGSTSFRRIDQSLIRRVISYLAKNPDASINVNGYASSDGSLQINQAISQARADAFKKYLVSKNVAESRVIALGKGIENPIASNDSNAGRQKNRRVEIILP